MALSDIRHVIYVPRPDPILDQSKEIYLQGELRRISEAIKALNEAVKHIVDELTP